MPIARDEIICASFSRTLNEHVVAGIIGNYVKTSGWESQKNAVGILKAQEHGPPFQSGRHLVVFALRPA